MRSVLPAVLVFVMASHSAMAQDPPTPENELNIFTKIVPPSPDAAKLASYVETPVSYFTGQPTVEIPIYELKGKELSLPVKLSYKSGGIKVEEISSGVGLGWSLIAGGVITRTVFGLPDEGDIGSSIKPFFDNYSRLLANKDGLPTGCENPARTISSYRSFQDDVMKFKTVDTQPDIYFFNFNGISGKLFLDESGTPRTIPFKNYLITPAVGPQGTGSWTVITDSGDKYIFGKIEQTRTTVSAGISEYDLPKNYPSSWYLTQIISKNGFDVYTFEYDETAEILVKTNGGLNEYRTDLSGQYDPLCATGITQGFSAGPVMYVRQVFLKKITDNHGRVVEINNVADRADYLGSYRHSSIVVKEATKTLLTATLFNNQYFGTGSETAKRLKLDRVEITGTLPTEPEVYRFQYNSGTLPDRLSYNQDLWGYYKANGGSTMIPAMDGLPGGVDRSPDENTTKACNLEGIYFPTGGYQLFTYELNGAGSTPLGGLRIKEINWYDDNTALVKKIVYRYTGQQISTPIFSTPNTLIRIQCPNENPNPPSCLYISRFAANRSQLGASAGSHVGYSSVEEEVRDFNDATGNGKTVYRFHVPNLTNAYPFSAPAFQDAVPLGLLLSKKIYNNSNVLLRSEESCYQGIVAENPSTESLIPSTGYFAVMKKSMIALQLASELTTYSKQLQWKYQNTTSTCPILYDRPCTVGYGGYVTLGYVPLKPYQFGYTSSFAFYPTGKVIREYLNGQELVRVEKYSYSSNNAYNFVVSKEMSTSRDNETLITDLVYPFQLTGQPFSTMVTKNMVTQIVEKKVSRKNGSAIPIYGEKYTFQNANGKILPVTYSIAPDGVNYRDEILGITYDVHGNVVRIVEKGVPKSYLWEDLYLVAEATGANAISYEGFEGKINDPVIARAGKGYSDTVYTAALLPNASSCKLSYWQRTNGKWQYVETTIESDTLINTVGDPIDEIRIFPPGAQVTTYSHEKGIGIISVMDINNKGTHFQFDDKRRLKLVVDDDGKILKKYEYHYRTGLVPTN